LILLVIGYSIFCFFTAPKSDAKVLKNFEESSIVPKLTHEKYNDFDFRKISVYNNDSLPSLVFVHGTIGSLNDFVSYFTDEELQSRYNMIAYDRIGYNYNDKNSTQESIDFERSMLNEVMKNIDKENVVLVGYSYGGPIALSFKEKVKKVVLLAPAIYSEYEVFPWMLNFYKWEITRWLVPKVWQEASKEKLSHQEDLKKHEKNWHNTPNTILGIHGDKDWIVPYENSKKLEKSFDNNQFELVTIQGAGHGLVWSDFENIKKELLKISE